MNKNGKSLKRYGFYDFPFLSYNLKYTEYYGTAEPPVRCGESHPSGLTEPLHFVY